MFFSLRNSIKPKLRLAMMLTSGLSILLAVVGFILYEYTSYQKILVVDISAKADLLSENVTAALVFQNKENAERTLKALESQSHIIAGGIFDGNDSLFATYVRPGYPRLLPAHPAQDGYKFTSNRLWQFSPIIFKRSRIGTIYLESDLDALYERFISFGEIGLLVLITSLLSAFALSGSLEKRISQPILALAETAKIVSERQDYSIRAKKISADEFGLLAESFNQMLTQIQERDASLLRTNEAMAQEIVDRKRAVEVLKASEERFRQLFQSHPLPMWVYDLKTLHFLVVNESAVRKYGYSNEEFLAMRISEIRPVEEIQRLEENLTLPRHALESSGPWKHRLKDGRVIDVEIISHLTNFLGREASLVVALDITERKKAEEELVISEERYRSLVAANTSIVWSVDPSGNFTYPQKSWEQYTGQRWEEHAGLGWLNAFPPEEREDIRRNMERAKQSLKAYGFEGKIWNNANQVYRYFTARSVPLLNPDKTVREWIGTVTDVHERKKAEEEIRQFNKVLEERVKERTVQLENVNKELEAFSYSVSHDLRAPIRHIDGFSELLLKKTAAAGDPKIVHYAKIITESAKKMGQLIDELLVFSRMGRTEMLSKDVDLQALVAQAVQESIPERQGRNVRFDVKPLPVVTGDPSMLQLVITNLLSNAVKYTGKREDARIEIGTYGRNGENIFYVKDNGAGFDMKYVDKLFGVFQRLHHAEEFGGIGIGLANVRRIIDRHGGRTWAEGEVEKGATFYFSLPIIKKEG